VATESAAGGVSRIVIVVWSAGPERPVQAAAPFVYALTARALELDVEMHFTSSAVRWLLAGVADQAFTDAAKTKTVADFIREAADAGVRLLACSMALAEHRRGEALISECHGQAGAATVMVAAIDPSTRTLVF
jgi:predicted peroxiredoxin